MNSEQRLVKNVITVIRIKRKRLRMAVSCFDFRMRATSFDLHSLTSGPKFARFSRLFRSKSDSDVKKSPPSSPTPGDAAKPSPGAPPRRRFVRVVRDSASAGEEYENPHVVRKYTKGFWEKKNSDMQSKSLEEGVSTSLPYTVTGHTILKKRMTDTSCDQQSPSSRHACFKEEVSVIEFDKKEKIVKRVCHFREEKLIDSDEYDSETSEQLDSRARKNYKKSPTNIESGKVMKQITCPIDEKAYKESVACAAGGACSHDGRLSPADISEESECTEDCDDSQSQCSEYTDMIASEMTKSLSDTDCDTECDKTDCPITERLIASHLELRSKHDPRGQLLRTVSMES